MKLEKVVLHQQHRVVCYTSFTFSYLSRAVILARTLRLAHPEWSIWDLIVDKAPPGVDISGSLAEFDHVLLAEELGIERFSSWIFKHNVIEACTAVKGRMLRHMFELGFEKVVYLDPDIGVFHPLGAIESKLDVYSIILTPHQVESNDTTLAVGDNEMASFKYGIYNLGFLAVRNDPVGRAFANWWDGMLYNACYEDAESGIYTDQKYCDIVPALFDRVCIERDPGCNVASWNISRRTVDISGNGDILVNGSSLKFYHFSKIGYAGDVMTERYSGGNFEVLEIWLWYKRQIQAGDPIPKSFWCYGTFSNGVVISAEARKSFRKWFTDQPDRWADPFEVAGDSFYARLQQEPPGAVRADMAGPVGSPRGANDVRRTDLPEPAVADASGDNGEFCDRFDEEWYIRYYTDVARAVLEGHYENGLDHYMQEGRKERRLPHYIPVDEVFYLRTYPDVGVAVATGLVPSAQAHFENSGFREGRRPYLDSVRGAAVP